MTRILHIITGLGVGGAESMLQKLVEGSDRSRFEHSVISLMDFGVIGERLRRGGFEVHALDGPRGYPTWPVVRGLSVLTARIRPEIIQGWMYHGNLAAWLARKFSTHGTPLIWGVRQSLGQPGDEKWLTRLVIRASAPLSGNADVVVYNAQRSRVQHEAAGFSGRSAMVIPNGFDTGKFVPSSSARRSVREELGVAEDMRLVGLIGRFHPMKDHRGFLEAAAEVVRRHDDVRFVMAGDGVSWSNPQLAGWLQELGLAERVCLLGRRDDVPRITAALDVVVSASARNEGFANVIGEAMSCGVPCAVTDVGDSALIVADTGRVVPPCAPSQLAGAVCALLELAVEDRARLGEAARARIVAEFSIGVVVGRFEKLYCDLVAGRALQPFVAQEN